MNVPSGSEHTRGAGSNAARGACCCRRFQATAPGRRSAAYPAVVERDSELDSRASPGHYRDWCRHDLLAETKESAVSAESADDPIVPLLIDELHGLLTREGLVEGVNLHLARQDDRLLIRIMAVTTGTLGVVLASLSDPAELDDPGSLTCRITPGEVRRESGDWEYELVATRYPIDQSIVFLANVRLPIGDLPEVVSRLRRDR